jgi:hypothetical protein
MALDLDAIDPADGRLIQAGLKHFGYYDGTMFGVPGPKTKDAYRRYLAQPEGAPQTELAAVAPSTPPAEPAELLSYARAVRDELESPGEIGEGTRGRKTRRVQEWLSIHGFRTAIDDDFGPATKRALQSFQRARGLSDTGQLDENTWNALVAPMVRAFSSCPVGSNLGETVERVATQHLREHPIELGGANCGPWVRAYMNGNQGRAWPWCAGFVTFVLNQAAQIHGVPMPIDGSFSCDLLASQAKQAQRFVSDRSLDAAPKSWSEGDLGACCVFLVRRTSGDWTHTGFAFDYRPNGTFATIEGNTNDEGSREGFEVCQRFRSRRNMDFIRLI